MRENARQCTAVVQQDSAAGQSLIIAGAGPSLADTAHECANVDQVWACNSALTWLLKHGHRVTHGFTINHSDAMPGMWGHTPDVAYLLASTVQPELTRRLIEAGRQVTFFHNLVFLPESDILYPTLYPTTAIAGAGLSAVTRAIDIAQYMGFASITVVGADCATQGDVMHVGGSAADWDPVFLSGNIDGRMWTSTADLWIDANWLTRMERAGQVRLVGDTLPVALRAKPMEFLNRLPRSVFLEGPNAGQPVPIEV